MKSLSTATVSSVINAALAKAKPITLTAGLLLSLGIPFENSSAIAQTAPTRTYPQDQIHRQIHRQPASTAPSGRFGTLHPIIGNWRGAVHNNHGESDTDIDTTLNYELQLSQNGQGSWQRTSIYPAPQPGSLTTNAATQGTLTYSIQNNNIVIQLSGHAQPMTLQGEIADDSDIMAGRVNGTNLFFRFIKF